MGNRRNPPAKWVLPAVVDPPDRICFMVSVPNERQHIAAFRGALYNLTSARFWADDTAHTAKRVAAVWANIYDQVNMTACNPQPMIVTEWESKLDICEAIRYHEGKLQGFCCGQWQDIGSDDNTAPTGNAGQPGGGVNQPTPGGCLSYNGSFPASSQWNPGVVVNAGDVITINSATGAGQGGSAEWRCVGGQQFFAGACVGSTTTSGGDPAPALFHGQLIASIAGVFYSARPGDTIVIPGGVLNAPVYFQANLPLSGASGSYSMVINVCNNQSGNWCFTFDFALSDGGWTLEVGSVGHWSAGVGWEADLDTAFGTYLRFVRITKTFASVGINDFKTTYNLAAGIDTTNGRGITEWNGTSGGTVVISTPPDTDGVGKVVDFSTGMISTQITINLACGSAPAPTDPGGTATITKVVLTGAGSNPFGTNNC